MLAIIIFTKFSQNIVEIASLRSLRFGLLSGKLWLVVGYYHLGAFFSGMHKTRAGMFPSFSLAGIADQVMCIWLTHSMCSIKTGKMKGGRKGRRQGRSEGGKKRGRENPDFYISLYCALPTSSVDPCSKLSRYVGSCLP